MNHLLSLSVILLLSINVSFAQKQFGVKVGANFGDIVETIEVATENTLGFEALAYDIKVNPQLGIWFDYSLTNRLSIQPELLWTQKDLHPTDNNPMDSYITFHYFSLPVLAKYQFGKLRVELGPETSFLLDQSFRNVNSPLDDSPDIDEHVFEFAINIGVQYTHNRWIVGARASRDVTTFRGFQFTDSNGELTGSLRNFHQSGVIWVGFQIL